MRWAWTQLQISQALAAVSEIESAAPAKRQRRGENKGSSQTSSVRDDTSFETESTGTSSLAHQIPPGPAPACPNPEIDLPELQLLPFLDDCLETLPFDFIPPDNGLLGADFHEHSFEALTGPFDCSSNRWGCSEEATSQAPLEVQSNVSSIAELPPLNVMSHTSISISGSAETDSERDWTRRPKRRRISSDWSRRQSSSLSPFSIDQSMIARSNDQIISTSLLQIYHDVLEHNLSCWLNEVTCPFGTNRRDLDRANTLVEWGSSWTNRILRRTMKLDRVSQSTKLIQLTKQQDSATARALHLSIMAFATQWAQGSRRQKERYSSLADVIEDDGSDEIVNGFAEEFDRHMQRNVWEQAQQALQEVADVESYRVVCAEMIFGLTQKPLTRDDEPVVSDSFEAPEESFDANLMADEITCIIERGGPPIHLERAARKMHALKYRYEAERKGLIGRRGNSRKAKLHSSMSNEDRGTIDLLYWLTVMFDTVSSVMSERPVVVSDANSQHDGARQSLDDGQWDVPSFIQDSLDKPSFRAHWPCSYEAAAEAVTRSAPVKVLMFRHVAYLQSILRRGEKGERVEEIVEKSASVYRYWNMTQ